MRAAAYNNPNRPEAHSPRKTAPHRPSFLIHCPELETNLTCTKQTAGHISNRQFFAFLKLPDTASAGRKARKEDRDARSRGRGDPCAYEKRKQIPHTVRQKRASGFGMTDITRRRGRAASRESEEPPPFANGAQDGAPDKRAGVNPAPPRNEKQIPHTVRQTLATGFGMTDIARRRGG